MKIAIQKPESSFHLLAAQKLFPSISIQLGPKFERNYWLIGLCNVLHLLSTFAINLTKI